MGKGPHVVAAPPTHLLRNRHKGHEEPQDPRAVALHELGALLYRASPLPSPERIPQQTTIPPLPLGGANILTMSR